jgi:hypothetical protein
MRKKEMNIRRKFLLGAVALVVPVASVVTLQGVASAKNATDPVNCTGLAGTLTFPSPGLSNAGSTQTSKKPVVTNVTGVSVSDCKEQATGNKDVGGVASVGGIKPIKVKPTPGSAPKTFVYNQCSTFTSSATLADAQKALKKLTFSFAAGTVKFKTATFNATVNNSGEAGFIITGSAKGPYGTMSATVNAFLLHDSGTGTTNNFTVDLGACNGGPGVTITSAQLDPATSTATV